MDCRVNACANRVRNFSELTCAKTTGVGTTAPAWGGCQKLSNRGVGSVKRNHFFKGNGSTFLILQSELDREISHKLLRKSSDLMPSKFGGTCPQRTQQCPKGSDPRLQTSTQENSASRFLKCSTECSAHFAQPTQDQERWRPAVEHRAAIHLVFDGSLADPRPVC